MFSLTMAQNKDEKDHEGLGSEKNLCQSSCFSK